MEIRISPELEAVVEQDVSTGRYATAEEYVAEAIELLHEREQWFGETPEEQREKLKVSLEQAERGELMSAEECREEMKAMKVEWMRGRLEV